MLEVRNLSKIYKAKKDGIDTHALDNVSLRFPEKGMVFLLGKSGSGKSTLLNTCGGLDVPTSGEIIVKGRSSKDFTQSDFDSYRNTFVGFIFQEYNILNEFTVEDNIALALELQGKPKDKKAIAELLEQVDLTGFAKRKPNTLSGGQKQRIAIARALVKSPEIIMADEPTGALDSATGKQVFDTLKKLSVDKLVIVVSHDREFAELYADRIIELKDGKIISDVTKTQETQQTISNNVTAIGDILCIKQGSDLTDDDFERIKSIIRKKSGDVIIAGDEKDVQNFKKVNRITDNGEKEVFKDTDESKAEKKTYTPEQSRFIRSKLPAKHAAKIGISGLKTKPVRLFFTILLCVVSFVIFGILSTLMLYNSEDMFKQTLKDSDQQFVVFDKVYRVENYHYSNGTLVHSYDGTQPARFNSEEQSTISSTFGEGSFGAISISAQVNVRQSSSNYWETSFTNAAYMPENAFTRRNIIGTYPENDSEICISSYFAKMLTECKTFDENGALIEVSAYADLVGKTIIIGGHPFKITGIFESGEIDPKFDVLKENTDHDYSIQMEYESLLNDGTHLLIAVSEDALVKFENLYGNSRYLYSEEDTFRRGYAYAWNSLEDQKNDSDKESWFMYYNSFSKLNSSAFISLTDNNSALSDDQAIIPFGLIVSSISSEIYSKRVELESIIQRFDSVNYEISLIDNEIANNRSELENIEAELHRIEEQMAVLSPDTPEYESLFYLKNDYETRKTDINYFIQTCEENKNGLYATASDEIDVTPENFNELYEEYIKLYDESTSLNNIIDIINSGRETIYSENGDPTVKEYSVEERGKLLSDFVKEFPEFANDLKLNFFISSDGAETPLSEERSYDVVGIIIPSGPVEDMIYFSDKVSDEFWNIQKVSVSYSTTSTKYKDREGDLFTRLYVPYDHGNAQTDHLWSVYNNEDFAENDSRIDLVGSYIDNLRSIDHFVVDFSSVFIYVGLVLAVFAILLFSNFISVSISQKRREIGILRAVGARSLDVFKIFFSESLTIAAICSMLSIGGSVVLCRILNAEIGSAIGASIFIFGIASVLIIFAIALFTAFLATFLPVWNAAKKKPVDSIRAI